MHLFSLIHGFLAFIYACLFSIFPVIVNFYHVCDYIFRPSLTPELPLNAQELDFKKDPPVENSSF